MRNIDVAEELEVAEGVITRKKERIQELKAEREILARRLETIDESIRRKERIIIRSECRRNFIKEFLL